MIPDRPIALVGMRCAGKSAVGWLLARRLERSFVDLDDEVVRFARHAGLAASSVAELLTGHGLARFRDLEATVLKKVLEPSPRVVLGTGGGVVERADNRSWLARVPFVVWLSCPAEVLQERLRGGGAERPPLHGAADPADEVPLLLARREPHYRALADLTLDSGELGTEALVEAILQGLGTERD